MRVSGWPVVPVKHPLSRTRGEHYRVDDGCTLGLFLHMGKEEGRPRRDNFFYCAGGRGRCAEGPQRNDPRACIQRPAIKPCLLGHRTSTHACTRTLVALLTVQQKKIRLKFRLCALVYSLIRI